MTTAAWLGLGILLCILTGLGGVLLFIWTSPTLGLPALGLKIFFTAIVALVVTVVIGYIVD